MARTTGRQIHTRGQEALPVHSLARSLALVVRRISHIQEAYLYSRQQGNKIKDSSPVQVDHIVKHRPPSAQREREREN